MRAVVQRVSEASVTVEGEVTGQIGRGFLVLLGIAADDSEKDIIWIADKIAGLRIFEDAEGRMNLGLGDVGGAVLLVSQFTLYGDCRKGRRPSFVEAAQAGGCLTVVSECSGGIAWSWSAGCDGQISGSHGCSSAE